MIPIRVDIAIVESTLIVPEPVLQLRASRERFRTEVFNVPVHCLPVLVLEIVQERREIGARFGAEKFRVP